MAGKKTNDEDPGYTEVDFVNDVLDGVFDDRSPVNVDSDLTPPVDVVEVVVASSTDAAVGTRLDVNWTAAQQRIAELELRLESAQNEVDVVRAELRECQSNGASVIPKTPLTVSQRNEVMRRRRKNLRVMPMSSLLRLAMADDSRIESDLQKLARAELEDLIIFHEERRLAAKNGDTTAGA